MTDQSERTRAMIRAEKLLNQIAFERDGGISAEIQREAAAAMRHFPTVPEIVRAGIESPDLFCAATARRELVRRKDNANEG